MSRRPFLASLARISDLAARDFAFQPLERGGWAGGDYVAAEVTSDPSPVSRIELATGRLIEVRRGDRVVGALGRREATLEATGDWRQIREDGRMHQLTPAGLFARLTSQSTFLPPLPELRYLGHVLDAKGGKLTMEDCCPRLAEQPLRPPVVLLIGSSMSAGKTTTACVIIRRLKERGLKIIGAKLTGAGRYRDILSMQDAGADCIYDFVDAGLPSTVCSPERFRRALRQLFARFSAHAADVVVAEAGASPLEPYNGEAAIDEIGRQLCCTILCASDPYAVLGLAEAFGRRPDLVSGVATSTQAGIALVGKLTGLRAANVLDPSQVPVLDEVLASSLGLEV